MIKWLGNRNSKVLTPASPQQSTQPHKYDQIGQQEKTYSLALDKMPCGDDLVPLIISKLVAEITPGIKYY
jgi:hypothetical protein